ncbi:adenine phosphoribosyltransferase [Ferroacidibacillus organovorans]|uniref:Adenine phosphoribosyltransferase n=1 Tax=Ferroacidibacillus organovorans TaxID=1765683 RepID=A0A162TD80_9BACL|nr:adenine phosphoribosyltransferase [Ferroacidibacillus organovorans]KYP80687.1 adenine phosphoribosyltransferase [Ferroacidibacillus organovorans]OAG93286.1 adenine phosphoribosyltransferase [Ferroacidibacillus organovorans]OPG15929.1 adenine phosphoribosyltransferase [Ferroacidibacillus organovorans]
MNLKEYVRVIEDFPEPGIRFKDITTLLRDKAAFRYAIDQLAERAQGLKIDHVVGPEARGFVIGAPLAYALGVGFVPIRKPGKLPSETLNRTYDLEYGKDGLEIHKDAIVPGERVLIVDDLLATGGTIRTTIELVSQLQGTVVGLAFLIELGYLKGRDTLEGYPIQTLITYA